MTSLELMTMATRAVGNATALTLVGAAVAVFLCSTLRNKINEKSLWATGCLVGCALLIWAAMA